MPDHANTRTKSKRGTIALTFWVLGIVVGTLSLASLIQNWGDIGLRGLCARVIDEYRDVAQAAKALFFDWWMIRIWPDFSLPDWTIDVISLWLLLAMSIVRSSYVRRLFATTWKSETGWTGERITQRFLARVIGEWRPQLVRRIVERPGALATMLIFVLAPLVFLAELLKVMGLMWERIPLWFPSRGPNRPNEVERQIKGIWLRFELAALGGMLAPVAGVALFFLWNAIQL